ncbi:hypothetical protein DL93DRAFT_2083757 [Clavulina sp. PMI_390]|nr:hypothetical protein DL93DRAFT_2083757 [Clavulina sp. PMI_390]
MSDKDPTYTPSSGRRANRQAHSRKSKPYEAPPDRSEGEDSDGGHENPKSRPRLRHSCLLCR